jgi:hypothetical protein
VDLQAGHFYAKIAHPRKGMGHKNHIFGFYTLLKALKNTSLTQ